MKHFQIIDNKRKTIVADNLKSNCKICMENCNYNSKQIQECPEYGGKRILGLKVTNLNNCFLCCDKTKTTKLFRQKIDALSYSFPDLIIPINEIRSEEQKKVNRLVHNLTSINAHNIQEIYDLVPQNVLALNWKKQLEFIKKEIASDLDKAALMFVRIAKHNTHMRSEFSIYRKIERDDNIELDTKEHNLRNVLLNTLHTFFADFGKRNIYVEVQDFHFKASFDYETIQVALYHLIENASKYTLPKSNIIISASDNANSIELNFEMISAHVKPEERSEVLKEGISGEMARKMSKQGDGIGMWRINQMLSINNGEFIVRFGSIREKRKGINFSNNVFIFKFPK